MAQTVHGESLTLRSAALITGIAYLLMPITIAEFAIVPRLVVAGDVARTIANISAHGSLFALAILCYLVTLILDIVLAWSLYVLFAPVNRSFSLLAAWFRIVFVAVGLVALLNLVNVDRLVNAPSYVKRSASPNFRRKSRFFSAHIERSRRSTSSSSPSTSL